MKLGRCLAISLLVLILAAPDLTGTWNLTVTLIYPDGTTPTPKTTVMTLTRSPDNPSLYWGTIADKGDLISLQQDAGANVHFAISGTAPLNSGSNTGYVASVQGRGTASAKNFIVTFGSRWGEIGTMKGTKQ